MYIQCIEKSSCGKTCGCVCSWQPGLRELSVCMFSTPRNYLLCTPPWKQQQVCVCVYEVAILNSCLCVCVRVCVCARTRVWSCEL